MVYDIQGMLTACEQIYFSNKALGVSGSSSFHHREFFTVHTAMVYDIQGMLTSCEQIYFCVQCVQWKTPDDGKRNCPKHLELYSKNKFARKLSTYPVCHTPLLCVQWKTPDGGQRKCPKHLEFYSKNKFEKLVHLIGFIIRIHLRHVCPSVRHNSTSTWRVFTIYRPQPHLSPCFQVNLA